MAISEIVTWASEAIGTGVVGSAAYDGLKTVLGGQFDKYRGYLTQNKQETFEAALTAALENNPDLLNQLSALKSGQSITTNTITGTIQTGHVMANGAVTVGHTIKN